MAQIVQYEAPPAATEFTPKMEGINALQQISEQLRRVAAREAEIGHQTGRAIDQGLSELGTGVNAMQAASKKANKQAELLAATQAESDLSVKQIFDKQAALKKMDPLDSTGVEKLRVQQKAERDQLLGTIKDPEIRAHIGAKNGAQDVSDADASVRLQGERTISAINSTLDKTLTNDLDAIKVDPHSAFKRIADQPAQMDALLKSSPGLDAKTAQKIATEHVAARQGAIAEAAIEAYAKEDPAETRKQLLPGGALHDLIQYLDPKQLEAVSKMPDYYERYNRAEARADRQDKIQASTDADNAFVDGQVKNLYSDDNMPRNVAQAHKDTLEAIRSGKISPTAGNSLLGALDKVNQQVEIGKEESTFNSMIVRASPDYEGNDRIVNQSQVWSEVTKGNLSFKRGKEFVDTFLKNGKSDPDFTRQATDWRKWGSSQLSTGLGDINGTARANEFARWFDSQIKNFGGDPSKFELNGPFYKAMVAKIQQLKHPNNQPAAKPKVDPGTPEAKGRPPLSTFWGGN